ncbi:signal recognition particle-docking protein FtsY, partial [Nitratireductor aquibiodomus]|uniref:signal recognition particle-docking protein FtsY n=1 Tax=Nitratireductor aquibiodomus TaxID=204799 RepID=UPI00046AD703
EPEPEPEPEPKAEISDATPAPPSPRSRGEGQDEGQRDADDITPAAEAAPTPSTDDARPSSGPSTGSGGEKEAEHVAEAASAAAAGKIAVSKAVERVEEKAPEPEAPPPRKPWFQRLREGLSRSSRELRDSIAGVFTKRKLDDDTLQDLEDVLLRADLGLETAMRVTDALASGRYGKDVSGEEVQAVMAEEIEKVLAPVAMPLELDLSHKPHVILVVGVNGTGKTTTIGKLAAKLTEGGLKVTLGAGDTFRAAAIEQLKIWGERTGSPVVSSKLGADAAGLAYDAYEKAKEAGSDVLIIDTAGRLQNKAELMAELEKIVRVLGKHDPDAPHTVLQTVDATTGQNALNQVEIFRNVAGVNGLVMTKLDGTARGGILVSIAAKHKLPVYFIGVGEQVDDLEPFSASDFAKAIAGVA